ncbi:MAG: antibiotic biosynthesis monooxygenase [Actinomycetota bacterium]
MSDTTPVVTTIVRRRVRPERREDYEAWLRRLLADAEQVPGYLGADVHPPAEGSEAVEYTSVFRFASLAELRAFERSELRERAMAEVVELVEADAVWDTHTGLELWFDPPPGTVVPQPVRWRMALLLGVVVYLLVLVFGAVAAVVIGGWPFPVRLAVVIAVEITLMTYVLLPWLTRRLRSWIYPSSSTV